jgi:hypothetical protein
MLYGRSYLLVSLFHKGFGFIEGKNKVIFLHRIPYVETFDILLVHNSYTALVFQIITSPYLRYMKVCKIYSRM